MIDAYSHPGPGGALARAAPAACSTGAAGAIRAVDALIDKAGDELDTPKRIPMMTEALQIAHDDIVFLPLHQQPMAWATRKHGRHSMVQLSDNKPRLWLHHDEVNCVGA